MIHNEWYEIVKQYTERLVAIRSVSPGEGEIRVAREVLNLLHADGLAAAYTASGLDPVEGDIYQRQNVYAFVRGYSASTIALLGHFDIVDTQDYGPFEQWALQPAELAARRDMLLSGSAPLQDSSDWMLGRGTVDMKSGVAVNIALIRHVAEAAQKAQFPLSIVMLATPDEENESAGVLQAVQFLLRLREQYFLDYLGVINTDYTTERYPGDMHRYIYAGSIGKLLPSFLCIGREGHVGAPFKGLDANLLAAELIRDLCMNDDLCDAIPGQITVPPVTLHATDLKAHYDVQLPLAAYFYVNILTLTSSPQAVLERLHTRAEMVLTQLLQRLDEVEQRWCQASGEQGSQQRFQPRSPRSGSVLTYSTLYAATTQQLGAERVLSELMAEWQRWPVTLDRRERSLRLTHRLWTLSGRQGPAIVIYYSPPYYPAVAPSPGILQDAIDAVVAAHPEVQLEQRSYYPYLSDMSYLRLDAGMDLTPLKVNMPVWQDADMSLLSGSYHLPLEDIQLLGLPVINWGPFGRGAHQRDESVLMSYSFGTLPQLIYETIEQLAQQV